MSLIYESKVPATYRVAFVAKVKTVAAQLGINPNWLMAIINWESAGSFSPSITNSIGATGLIQFMPSTAIGLGTTTANLRAMTAVQQMDYVYKYFKPWAPKIKSYWDCYLVVFFPVAVGKPDTFIIKTSRLTAALIAAQNPGFDLNKDKQITVGEIKQKMLSMLPSEWMPEFVKKKD